MKYFENVSLSDQERCLLNAVRTLVVNKETYEGIEEIIHEYTKKMLSDIQQSLINFETDYINASLNNNSIKTNIAKANMERERNRLDIILKAIDYIKKI